MLSKSLLWDRQITALFVWVSTRLRLRLKFLYNLTLHRCSWIEKEGTQRPNKSKESRKNSGTSFSSLSPAKRNAATLFLYFLCIPFKFYSPPLVAASTRTRLTYKTLNRNSTAIHVSPPPPPPSSPPPPPPSPQPPPPSTDVTRSPPSPPESPTPPTTPTPPRSGTRSPPSPPASPSGKRSPQTPSITPGFSPSSPPSSSSRGLSTGVVVGIAIGGVAVLVALTLICFLCKKRRRRDHEAPPAPKAEGTYGGQKQKNASRPSDHELTPLPPQQPPPPPPPPGPPPGPPPFLSSGSVSDSNYSDHQVLPPPSLELVLGVYQGSFTYEELDRATNGFSEANFLGQGGFGYVYKGVLRDGKEIAVKQLKAGSAQGEREFQAEVGIISRVHHRHLVALVGYCIADAQRLLVYEFVPNNNLEFHLHARGRPPMEWSSRFKIAVGSAKGLSYLHENCNLKIIHRDIKAANILIDLKFEAKVADFALAKIVPDTYTHVSTRVMGTFGYLAPKYAASGKLTEKSDVYSFGVVLLELITGRPPVDANNANGDENLVDWVIHITENNLNRLQLSHIEILKDL